MADKSALELMPVELRQQLLRSLPDLMSLRSTVLTCSSFYQTFTNAEVFITTSVITNQVHSDVLPEAVAAVESSRLSPLTLESIRDFLDEYLSFRKTQPPSWTLSQALPLDGLHHHVKHIAAACALETLTEKLELSEFDTIPDHPPSYDEIHRIL